MSPLYLKTWLERQEKAGRKPEYIIELLKRSLKYDTHKQWVKMFKEITN